MYLKYIINIKEYVKYDGKNYYHYAVKKNGNGCVFSIHRDLEFYIYTLTIIKNNTKLVITLFKDSCPRICMYINHVLTYPTLHYDSTFPYHCFIADAGGPYKCLFTKLTGDHHELLQGLRQITLKAK